MSCMICVVEPVLKNGGTTVRFTYRFGDDVSKLDRTSSHTALFNFFKKPIWRLDEYN